MRAAVRRAAMALLETDTRLAIMLAGFLVACGSMARAAFAAWFMPETEEMRDLARPLALGLRFDLRWAIAALLPVWLLSVGLPKRWAPTARVRRAAWKAWWLFACGAWGVAVVLDFGFFAYLGQRLSALAVTLAKDAGEAAGMIWATYPVPAICAGLLAWLAAASFFFGRAWRLAGCDGDRAGTLAAPRRGERLLARVLITVAAVGAIHGSWSQYPLRWSDSAEVGAPFWQAVSLNPMQNLVDTWRFRAEPRPATQLRAEIGEIGRFVGLPDGQAADTLSLLRSVPAAGGARPRNVVLVLLESFSGHKVGAIGNPMGATPHFDALAGEGILFTRMMTAHAHTARGIFATLAGIPDVTEPGTASRNPAAVSQHMILAELSGHAKAYFLGGSASWANIRGFLAAGVDGLEIFDERNLRSPRVDVWGVSDRSLFAEANDWARLQRGPFFMVVQTSGNHRPYTIPDEDREAMGWVEPPLARLREQGFDSPAEFNAFRYLDWCVGWYMRLVRREAYFDDTLFVFLGDHGISGPTGPHLPPAWEAHAITQGHTPLLLYAPRHLAPRVVHDWAQQVDVMPTIASLLGVEHRNTTLGRDLLDARFDDSRLAFTFRFGLPGTMGLLVGHHYLRLSQGPGGERFEAFRLDSDQPLAPVWPEAVSGRPLESWRQFLRAYHDVAEHLIVANPRLATRR